MQPPAWSDPPFTPLEADDPPDIGGYRVLARLGAGGMGRVYLATTQSGRRLAVKVIRPEFADDPEFRRRFGQEVTAAQRVQSRYTAAVIDAQVDGPRPWMATAYVPGPSLAQAVMANGPMPEETVRTLLTGMAEALQAIHGSRVVHRDLKPSNVLLAGDGPRVIDFGIARAADTTPLTRTGMRIGSPQFMAPEQALGRDCTTAVDYFALGSVIFFAATGRTPFGDGPDTAVLFRIAHEEPNLDGCPESLRDLLRRCLDKDPAARPDAAAILAELAADTAAPSSGWLPDDVTRRLPAYAAAPPPPHPGTTPHMATAGTTPIGTPPRPYPGPPPGRVFPVPPPGAPFPPGARPPASSGSAATKIVIGGVASLLLFALIITVGVTAAHRSRSERGTPLGAAPSAAATNSGGGTENGKGIGSRLGHYTDINLSNGYTVSFTDDPKHPKSDLSKGDLTYDGYTISGSRLSVLPPGQSGNYENCHDSTRYTNQLGSEYLIKNKLICATTDSGLIGLIKIKERGDDPSEYVTFDLTVYQGTPPTPGE
ncbi:serine/threonine-protein kinase [Actinomadura decatromicini]|uniref:Serine/threonine protein kinase n=1 Tax=Actinomadura decatromicini TaxID=2604572 RepID=A0A5D3FM30_9ACTN|nr:serine/threonine-protein kinase [Actinomadura decatromicini]TYK49194.1 serine/threonine protein kinase [Actinomadura decatromicini]